MWLQVPGVAGRPDEPLRVEYKQVYPVMFNQELHMFVICLMGLEASMALQDAPPVHIHLTLVFL